MARKNPKALEMGTQNGNTIKGPDPREETAREVAFRTRGPQSVVSRARRINN